MATLGAWRRAFAQFLLGRDRVRELEERQEVLATIQSDTAVLRERLDGLAASTLTRADYRATLEWISGAELHLASLQASNDRGHVIHKQHEMQLDRILVRLTQLESRTSDIERADTELAVAIAKTLVSSDAPR